MPINAFSLAVVGIDYPNKRGPGRRFELEICRPGEPVELRHEPKNPYDERAVAVFSCRGIQLGYIKAERAPLIVSMIAKGREPRAIFQRLDRTCAWARVTLDGSEPQLPSPAPDMPVGADPDSGFWPDPVYDGM